jgi:hypothetical protein
MPEFYVALADHAEPFPRRSAKVITLFCVLFVSGFALFLSVGVDSQLPTPEATNAIAWPTQPRSMQRPQLRVARVPAISKSSCGCPNDSRIDNAAALMRGSQVMAQSALQDGLIDKAKGAAALALSAMIMAAGPASADLASSSKDFTDAAYPIVKTLKANQVQGITQEVIDTALTADPKGIIQTIDKGLDAFLSAPPEKFFATAKALKEATAEAKGNSKCELICVPSLEASEKAGAVAIDALASANKGKVKAFIDQATVTFNSAAPDKVAKTTKDLQKFTGNLDPQSMINLKAAAESILEGAN